MVLILGSLSLSNLLLSLREKRVPDLYSREPLVQFLGSVHSVPVLSLVREIKAPGTALMVPGAFLFFWR